MNLDENDEKRRYKCVIWPKNYETDEKRCVIHDLERARLGIGGRLASRADVYPNEENPNTLVVSYFTINKTDITVRPPMRIIDMDVTIQHRHSQNWDKGGCYLDPQEVEDA